MMRRLTMYVGLAIAACLSCFSLSALAQPIASAYRVAAVAGELQGSAMKRLELTLAMWRTGSHSTDKALKTNLLASSNHFVMASANSAPDGVGLTPC